MLKFQGSRCGLALVVATCLCGGVAVGASEAEDKPKMTRADVKKMLLADPTKLYANEFDARGLKLDERKMLALSRYLRDGKALQSATLEQLTLPDNIKAKINSIFQDQFDYVVATNAQPRTLDGRPKDHLAKPGSPNAPVPEQTKTASGISAKEINRPGGSPFDDPQALINRIAVEIPKDQAEKYGVLAERWRRLRPQGAADGPIRQLMRAVMDPKLGLSDELENECRSLLIAKISKLGRDRQYLDKRLQATAEGKTLVLAKLNEAQRAQYEKTLSELQDVYAEEIAMLMEYRAERDKPAVKKDVPVKKEG